MYAATWKISVVTYSHVYDVINSSVDRFRCHFSSKETDSLKWSECYYSGNYFWRETIIVKWANHPLQESLKFIFIFFVVFYSSAVLALLWFYSQTAYYFLLCSITRRIADCTCRKKKKNVGRSVIFPSDKFIFCLWWYSFTTSKKKVACCKQNILKRLEPSETPYLPIPSRTYSTSPRLVVTLAVMTCTICFRTL